MEKKVNKIKQPTLCIISLTYNRPAYIERSFESLYKRAGMFFRHYVFDDGSNLETRKLLKELKKKYKFKLFLNVKRKTVGVYKHFYFSFLQIPKNFDYYVKLDSDVEILTDNFFPQILDLFAYKKEMISGVVPRAEGIKSFDRYVAQPEFYGSHTIKVTELVLSGCCMCFPAWVLEDFEIPKNDILEKLSTKWGIDSVLLDHSLTKGRFIIADDLSVYHIDNSYGQRRRYPEYFTNRKRWVKIDNDEVWYVLVSKEIYPDFISRPDFEKLRKRSPSFLEFLEDCKRFILNKGRYEEEQTNIKQCISPKKESIIKQMPQQEMYKITSPLNFKPSEYIPHGESRYFKEIPIWAKNNASLVVEKVDVYVPSESKKTETLKQAAEETGKQIRKCQHCNYQTLSLKRLKTHIEKKHSSKK